MKRVLSLLLLLVAFAGVTVLNANQDSDKGTPVPFTELDPKRPGPRRSLKVNSGILDPLRVVVRDRDAWLKMWKLLSSKQFPRPPLPEIDFSREMLIVVGMGERNSGGYDIIVDGVYERDKKLEVDVKSTSPGRACGVPGSITEPADVVRVQKSDYPVVFRETNVTRECK
jgi:PrcB C-terminal